MSPSDRLPQSNGSLQLDRHTIDAQIEELAREDARLARLGGEEARIMRLRILARAAALARAHLALYVL